MDPFDGEATQKVAEILKGNPDGISRAGLLAWSRLRISPDFSEDQLDAALAALGPSVSIQDGFVRSTVGRSSSIGSPWGPGTEASAPGSSMPPDAQPGWRPSAVPEAPVPPGIPPVTSVGPGPSGWAAARPVPRLAKSAMGLLGLAAMIALVVLGRSAGGGSSPGSTAIPSDPRGSIMPAASLTVGTCFVIPIATEFSEVEVRPCDAPHDGEIFATWDDQSASGAAFPTQAQWEAKATAHCEPAFGSYTGTQYSGQSALDYGWFAPTEAGWKDGDRTVQCYLGLAGGGPVSRSYRSGS